ncbi:MAG: hypothetical protein DRO23_04450 [Thermoprotei archaeon]|nr:MAG: hypothetical protein DRO23_04450 [Thermoprotei archaeon]
MQNIYLQKKTHNKTVKRNSKDKVMSKVLERNSSDYDLNIRYIIKGGFWLYSATVVQSIAGFLYWFILSAIGGLNVLGYTSTIVSLSVLIAGLLSLGVDFSVQKFIGKSLGNRDNDSLRLYFWTSALIFLGIYMAFSTILLFLGLANINLGNIAPKMLILTSLLLLLNYSLIFHGVLIALIRTDLLLLSTIIGSVLRFIVGIPLVIHGWGWIGATLGYACSPLVMIITGTLYTLKRIGTKIAFSLAKAKEVLHAGFAVWFPKAIFIVGQWSSVVVVFSFLGASETGRYYIAFAISTVILMASTSMIKLLLPVLSSMSDGRKRIGWKVLKLSLALSTPLMFILIAYPTVPLSILGREYMLASDILRLLIVATIPLAISNTVVNLVFSYGMYTKVLKIGLCQNIPRLILYIVLVRMMSGLGVAISYLIGSITGLLSSLKVASDVGFKIAWNDIGKILAAPLVVSTVAYIFPPSLWPILSLTIILVSLISYIKLNVLDKYELKAIVTALLPRIIAVKLNSIIDKLVDIFAETES